MTPEEERVTAGLAYLIAEFGPGTLQRLRKATSPGPRYDPLNVRSDLRCPLAVAGQASFMELRVRLNLKRHQRVALGFEPETLGREGWDALQATWWLLLEKAAEQ